MGIRFKDETGIGMILVIGITVFVAGLTATAGIIAINGLGESRHRIQYEQSMADTEVGINYALSQLQSAFDRSYKDYPIPTPKNGTTPGIPTANCTAPQVTAPDFALQDEEAWAKAQLDSLVKNHAECFVDTPTGQVMMLKPKNPVDGATVKFGRVYARSFSPRYGTPSAVSRTVKVEYVLVPYQPKYAILTGDGLAMSGQMTVAVVPGKAANSAAIHTNGVLSGTANSIDVQGPLTYTEGASGKASGWSTQSPRVSISYVSAKNFYPQAFTATNTGVGQWTDLCPDGMARPYSTHGPCDMTLTGVAPANWSYDSSSHTWNAGSSISGTFYAHQANVDMTKTKAVAATVIASASSETCADKRYGNIHTKQSTVGSASVHGLWLMADADLDVDTQSEFGTTTPLRTGMFVAGDQFTMQSNTPNMVTGLVAGGQCETRPPVGLASTSSYQGANMFFDPDTDSPWSSMINIALWQEY